MSKFDLESIGKLFVDLAENKDAWEVDYSLSLFRKKLKIAGQKISEAFKYLDEYIQQKVEEVLKEMKTNDAVIENNVSSLNNEVNSSNASIGKRIDLINAEIVKIKKAHKAIETNLNILIKNDQNIVKAINDLYKSLEEQKNVQITTIIGGSALD